MWFSHLRLKDIKSFQDTNFIPLSKGINIITGQNNAGKSTILNSILILQHKKLANLQNRLNSGGGTISLIPQDYFDTDFDGSIWRGRSATHNPFIKISVTTADTSINVRGYPKDLDIANTIQTIRSDIDVISLRNNFEGFPNIEPKNIIYPFLSKRKTTNYNEQINTNSANSVTGNFENLYAKVDRLCDSYNEGHNLYDKYCTEIFGYPISCIDTQTGKRAAYRINSTTHIPLTDMGEGVPNLLALLVDLCLAKNKVFLIEELENDIHPKALKAISSLIIEKSRQNQFFISTHSNIVLKELGADSNTSIFQITMNINKKTRVPESKIHIIGNEKQDRIRVLEDLGYEFQDYDLWKAWLFLEESSAELIIRQYFIKWYAPNLVGKLKTFSARSKDEVKPKFDNFNSLFVFLHLEPTYKNKAWVIIDDGDEETVIINKMKEIYTKSGWSENQFRQFSQHNFEAYYPQEFKNQEEINTILSITDKKEKREAKQNLLNELTNWIDSKEETAKIAFSTSAKEVIDILKEIDIAVNN